MTPIGIQLKLGGEREVETGLRRVGGAMDTVGTAASALARAVGGVAGAFAGALSVREFVQAADAVTGLQNQLKLATGSAQAAGVAYNQLYEISQRSRTGFIELGKTFASISTAAADMGVSQQRLLKVTEAIGNAVTISGTGAQAAQAALQQLGQGLASGTLRGEELNSVMEQTPRLAKALADGLGVTRGELRALGQQGAITAEQVIKALESQSSVLQGEVKDATLTVGQAFTQLTNSATRAVGDFDKATGATATLAGTISSLAGAVDTLGGVIRNNEGAFKVLGGTLAGAAVVAGAAGIVKSIGLIGGAVAALGAVLLANPAVLALLGLSAAVGGGVALISAQSKTADGIGQAIERLRTENERSEAALARAVAGGRLAGADNIAKTIDARKDQIAKLRAELDSLQPASAGAGGGRGSVNPQTVGAAAAQQAAGEKELIAIRQKLYGVDKDYLPTLTKLHAQYTSGAISIDEYQKLVGKLAEANFKKEKADPGRGLKSEESAYQNLIATINTKIAQEREELAGAGALTESQRIRIKLDQDLAAGRVKLSAQNERAVRLALEELAASEASAEAAKTLAKANLDAAASREKYLTSLSTGLDKIQADIAAQIEATERMGLSKEAIAELDAAKLEMLATDLELQAIKAMDRNLDQQTYDALKKQAAAYRELGIAKKGGAAKEAALDLEKANAEAAKKAQEDWERASEQINSSLTDALMRGFESGKDFAKNMRDTVVNMFKTMVLRPIISMVLSPISGALTGMMGLAGTANAATGAAGVGGLGGILNAGGNIYSALTNGISGSISSAFSTFAGSGVGQSLGLSNSAAIMGNNPSAFVPAGGQLTGLGSSIGSGLGMLGSGLAGYGISSMLSGGYSAGKGVNAIAGIASAIPGIGPIAGVIGGLINRAFGRKLKDSGIEGTLGGEAGFEGRGFDFYKGGWLRSDKTKYKDLDPTVSGGLSDAFKSIQAQVGTFATVLGLNADKVASFTTDIKVSFKGLDEAGIQKALQDALATGSNELAQQVLGALTTTTREVTETLAGGMGDWGDGTMQTVTRTIEETTYAASEYAREGEKAIDTLSRLATSVTTVNDWFERLGLSLYEASLQGADAASSLADLFGGLENFSAAASTYYDNFYSEAEKAANVTRDVTAALADVGLQMPTTREEFRALVEQQVALGESGAQAVATLLSVSGAFASVTAASETAAEAAARLADEQAKAAKEAQDAYQKQARAAQEAADVARRAHEDLLEALTKAAEQALKILGNAIDAEKKVQQAEYDAQMAIIDAQRKASTTFVEAQRAWLNVAIDSAKNYAKALESEAARIRGFFTGMVLQDDPDAPAGASVFSAQAALRAGDTSDAVLRKATDIDPEMFSSWADYAINFFDTKSIVDQYATQAERAASVAASDVALLEQQLTKAEEQYQADLDHYTRLEGIAKDTLEANILRLDGILQAAQDQLEEAAGTKLAVMGLGAALGNFAGAVTRLSDVTGNPVTTPLPTTAPVLTTYGTADRAEAFVAQVTAYNPVISATTSSSANNQVVNVLREVVAELQALRTTGADTRAAVEKTTALLDQVTGGGNAMLTETA